MTISYLIRGLVGVIALGISLSGCAWYIEPQKRAMIDILTQVDLNHQAIIHANQTATNCTSSTVGDRFITSCQAAQ